MKDQDIARELKTCRKLLHAALNEQKELSQGVGKMKTEIQQLREQLAAHKLLVKQLEQDVAAKERRCSETFTELAAAQAAIAEHNELETLPELKIKLGDTTALDAAMKEAYDDGFHEGVRQVANKQRIERERAKANTEKARKPLDAAALVDARHKVFDVIPPQPAPSPQPVSGEWTAESVMEMFGWKYKKRAEVVAAAHNAEIAAERTHGYGLGAEEQRGYDLDEILQLREQLAAEREKWDKLADEPLTHAIRKADQEIQQLREELAEAVAIKDEYIDELCKKLATLDAAQQPLVDALEQISERRVLVMDDEGETEADAMVKVATVALAKMKEGK